MRPKIAIFDYKVTSTNAVGSCHLTLIRALCEVYDFTVFAVEFDNPNPDRVAFVRIPVQSRPLAVLFLLFHIVSPIAYLFVRARSGIKFDVIQGVENYVLFPDVAYVHFCHKAYLKSYWGASTRSSIRSVLRWVDHLSRAGLEAIVYKRVRMIVVPSEGLAKELAYEYPGTSSKISIVANPIQTTSYLYPDDFRRQAYRQSLGVDTADFAFCFIALGHFERKGLPIILKALSALGRRELKLLVVGGNDDLLLSYAKKVQALGLKESVVFAGMQEDIRPFLWASDAFLFPSSYETFSLATFQAAAAGLPILCSDLHGVREFLVDGFNGIVLRPTVESVLESIVKVTALRSERRLAMGAAAKEAVQRFDVAKFVPRWNNLYEDLLRTDRSSTQLTAKQ